MKKGRNKYPGSHYVLCPSVVFPAGEVIRLTQRHIRSYSSFPLFSFFVHLPLFPLLTLCTDWDRAGSSKIIQCESHSWSSICIWEQKLVFWTRITKWESIRVLRSVNSLTNSTFYFFLINFVQVGLTYNSGPLNLPTHTRSTEFDFRHEPYAGIDRGTKFLPPPQPQSAAARKAKKHENSIIKVHTSITIVTHYISKM